MYVCGWLFELETHFQSPEALAVTQTLCYIPSTLLTLLEILAGLIIIQMH